jgi:hypothetical protein
MVPGYPSAYPIMHLSIMQKDDICTGMTKRKLLYILKGRNEKDGRAFYGKFSYLPKGIKERYIKTGVAVRS